jgi:hypothetical protein
MIMALTLEVLSRLWFEVQRRGIYAVALAGWAGPIVEDVPEVPAAAATEDLRAFHEEAIVGP